MRYAYSIRLWGSGSGPARMLAPVARILAGLLLFVAVVWSQPDQTTDLILLLTAVLLGVYFSGIPGRYIWSLLFYGVLIFGPIFLLAPFIHPGPAFSASAELAAVSESLRTPWVIFSKGIAGLLVAAATVSVLPLSDLYDGLARLPLPRLVVIILVQVVHQAKLLFDQTGKMAQAIALRKGSSGVKTGLFILRTIPSIWLPRMLFKAERVAAAMDLRGYGNTIPRFDSRALGLLDWIGILVTGLLAGFIIFIG